MTPELLLGRVHTFGGRLVRQLCALLHQHGQYLLSLEIEVESEIETYILGRFIPFPGAIIWALRRR